MLTCHPLPPCRLASFAILLSCRFIRPAGSLPLFFIGLRPPHSPNLQSDPYVEVSWRGIAIGSTDVISNTLDPVWTDELFDLDLPWQGGGQGGGDDAMMDTVGGEDDKRRPDERSWALMVSIYDHDTVGGHTFLGCAMLDGNAVVSKGLGRKGLQSTTLELELGPLPESSIGQKKRKKKATSGDIKGSVVLSFAAVQATDVGTVAGMIYDLVNFDGSRSVAKAAIVGEMEAASRAPDHLGELGRLVSTCTDLAILFSPQLWQKRFREQATVEVGHTNIDEWVTFCTEVGGTLDDARSRGMPETLRLGVLKGSGLMKADLMGKSDPYVVEKGGEGEARREGEKTVYLNHI